MGVVAETSFTKEEHLEIENCPSRKLLEIVEVAKHLDKTRIGTICFLSGGRLQILLNTRRLTNSSNLDYWSTLPTGYKFRVLKDIETITLRNSND